MGELPGSNAGMIAAVNQHDDKGFILLLPICEKYSDSVLV
jgi:hypothetical protein